MIEHSTSARRQLDDAVDMTTGEGAGRRAMWWHAGVWMVMASLWVVGAGSAMAQPAPSDDGMSPEAERAMQERKNAVETRARTTVRNLFQRLCPGRCELVSMEATMSQPEAVGAVSPGFGSGANQSFDVQPESLQMTVLLDSKLPGNFRQNLPRMIEYQLEGMASQINVRPETMDFPTPQNRPMPPTDEADSPSPRRPPPRRPAPRTRPEDESDEDDSDDTADEPKQKSAKAQKTEPEPEMTWGEFFRELAPWVGPTLMMAVLFLLSLPLLRRLSDLTEQTAARVPEEGASGGGAGPDIEQLRQDLTRSRSLKNRVLRRWLEEDPEGVAMLVRLVGPEILDDLKTDDGLDDELEEVSERIAQQRSEMSDDEVERVVNEARARLDSARVVHSEQGLASDWEFLEGLSVSVLRRVLQTCDTRETLHVIGHLPASLRASYLDSLERGQRQELFMAGGDKDMSRQESIELAARLRRKAEEYSHVGRGAGGQAALIIEMLESLESDEQREALRELQQGRPSVAESVLGQVCLESTCAALPPEVLADAMYRMPVDTLATFLRGAEPEVRDRFLEVAPGEKRADLETELSLEVPVGTSEYLESRQDVMSTVRESARREGVDLVEANRQVLSAGRTAGDDTQAPTGGR
jgi:flagellar motor switch protein FliG